MAAGRACKNDCGNQAEKDRAECSSCRYARRTSVDSKVAHASRVLMLDIETAPITAYTWGMFKQNISLPQMIDPGRILCFGAKWLGQKGTMFFSEFEHGRRAMLEAARDLLDEADVVMHYNGKSFDIPWINGELFAEDIAPPSPFAQVDLLLAVRRRFRFPSNKLAHVSKVAGLPGKVEHEGFSLWPKCMAGDPAAWKSMEKYCRQDVELLQGLYMKLRPWLPDHPNGQLYGGTGCPACGSDKLQSRGYTYTKVSKFRQYQCQACGSYFRDTKREHGVDLQSVAV